MGVPEEGSEKSRPKSPSDGSRTAPIRPGNGCSEVGGTMRVFGLATGVMALKRDRQTVSLNLGRRSKCSPEQRTDLGPHTASLVPVHAICRQRSGVVAGVSNSAANAMF